MPDISSYRKKILFVITKSNWGGAQRYVFDLATHLPQEDFEVLVALGGVGSRGADAGLLKQKLDAAGVRTTFVQSFMRDIGIANEWAAFRELITLFKLEKPDVVHLNSSKAGGLGALAARLAGVKNIIFTSHGLTWEEDRNVVAKVALYVLSWITFLLAHKTVAITSQNYTKIRALPFCKNKVTLIHNGIAPELFKTKEEACLSFEALAKEGAEFGIENGPMVVGGIGELTWNKGWHYLLRAVSILKRRGTPCRAVIIGGGEERVFLDTLIKEEDITDRATLLGFVPDAAQYLKMFDIYTLTSLKEGLPYVLLEASQAGLSVVASQVGGVPDIVSNRINGLTFKSKSAEDLADKLEQLLKDESKRKQYAEALKKRVDSEFSLEQMLTQTKALY